LLKEIHSLKEIQIHSLKEIHSLKTSQWQYLYIFQNQRVLKAILHWRWSLRCETLWEIHSKAWDVRRDEKSILKPEMWDVMRSPF
jgi:hypothetical protein